MEVRFVNEAIISADTHCTAKVIWRNRYPMRAGKFPSNHPVSKKAMDSFRNRGYWASCYPEGDGITFYSLNGPKEDEKVIQDIEECFGFMVSAKNKSI